MQEVFEKIIEKLKIQKDYYKTIRKNTYCRRTEMDDCDSCRADHYLEARLSAIDDAIEIVKQVGVSDDVCEWIKYDYRTIFPKNHDANNPYWRIPDNTDKLKYCPYCGKKIKVVE